MGATKKQLTDEFQSHTHKFTISGEDFYLTLGFDIYGNIFYVNLANNKEEYKAYSVMMDMASLALRNGTPVEDVAQCLSFHEHGLAGVTNTEYIQFAKSIEDYIGKYISANMVRFKRMFGERN